MVNYLALLGWGPPDGVEVRPVEELSRPGFFDIASVSPSPAAFDVRKLESVNGDHIRMLSTDEFVRRCLPFLEQQPWFPMLDMAVFEAIAPEVQTRVKTLAEVPALVDFMFMDQPVLDEASVAAAITNNPNAPELLDGAAERLEHLEWSAAALHAAVEELANSLGLKLGKAQAPIRVAVTGSRVGPPLFESLALMPRDVVLDRIGAARKLVVG
jgi:glutamyl-tRNA synthetase